MLKRISLLLLVVTLSLSPASGQKWLKKIENALNKSNEFLDKVDKALSGESSGDQKAEDKTAQQESANYSVDDLEVPPPLPIPVPHGLLDCPVILIPQDAAIDKRVKDGMINIYSRENGHSYFNIKGEKVFGWGIDEGGYFDNGACRFKKEGRWGIMYKNGTHLYLPDGYQIATDFIDGIAIALVTTTVSYQTKKKYIYINIYGEEVFPHLAYTWKSTIYGAVPPIAPISEGLRAYYDLDTKKYGFIDDEGKIVVKAQYDEVGNFSEGLAAVMVKEDHWDTKPVWGFIDKTGAMVIPLQFLKKPGAFSNGLSATMFFDEKNYYGIYYYVNKSGEKVGGPYVYASDFTDGYAFVLNKPQVQEKFTTVINTQFKPVGTTVLFNTYLTETEPFAFYNGIAQARKDGATSSFIYPDGEILLEESSLNTKIGDFYGEELAYCRTYVGSEMYEGFIDLNGKFKFVFRPSSDGFMLDICCPPLPTKADSPPPPVYSLVVKANPEEGGDVKGSGTYKAFEKVKVSVAPKNEYKFFGWERDGKIVSEELSFEYAVRSKTDTLIARLSKKADSTLWNNPPPPLVPYYEGQNTLQNVKYSYVVKTTVYMEFDAEKKLKTPYGNNEYGYLAVCVAEKDLAKIDVLLNRKPYGHGFARTFFYPLRIYGFMYENGKSYMVTVGGGVVFSMLDINTDPIAQLIFSFAVASAKNVMATGTNHLYRIEFNVNNDGSISFGELNRFAYPYGWLDPGDRRLERYKDYGLWSEDTNAGLPIEYVKGVTVKEGKKRDDILWAPPQSWYIDFPYAEAYRKIIDGLYELKPDIYDVWDNLGK